MHVEHTCERPRFFPVARGLLILALAAFATSCGSDDQPAEDQPAPASEAGAPAETNAPVSVVASTAAPIVESTPETPASSVETDPPQVDDDPSTTTIAEPVPGTEPDQVPEESSCLDDPSCGDAYWDPAPAADQPLEISLDFPAVVRVGEQVKVVLAVSDPDAGSFWNVNSTCDQLWVSTDGPLEATRPCSQAQAAGGDPCMFSTPVQHGPITPAPRPGTEQSTNSITYREPGIFILSAEVISGNPRCVAGDLQDPFSSVGRVDTTIEVLPALEQ